MNKSAGWSNGIKLLMAAAVMPDCDRGDAI